MKKSIKKSHLEEMIQAGAVKKFKETKSRNYYVSVYGNFYSQNIKKPEEIIQMSLSPDGQGYLRANIDNQTVKVHIVVAETFIRPRKDNEVINHINQDRAVNYVWNLEVTTQSQNMKSAWDFNKERRKLTYEQAEQIRQLHAIEGLSLNALARQFNCPPTSVKQVVEFKTFKKGNL